MRNSKNKFYGKLKVNKETRKAIKFFGKIKLKMVSELVKK